MTTSRLRLPPSSGTGSAIRNSKLDAEGRWIDLAQFRIACRTSHVMAEGGRERLALGEETADAVE